MNITKIIKKKSKKKLVLQIFLEENLLTQKNLQSWKQRQEQLVLGALQQTPMPEKEKPANMSMPKI